MMTVIQPVIEGAGGSSKIEVPLYTHANRNGTTTGIIVDINNINVINYNNNIKFSSTDTKLSTLYLEVGDTIHCQVLYFVDYGISSMSLYKNDTSDSINKIASSDSYGNLNATMTSDIQSLIILVNLFIN